MRILLHFNQQIKKKINQINPQNYIALSSAFLSVLLFILVTHNFSLFQRDFINIYRPTIVVKKDSYSQFMQVYRCQLFLKCSTKYSYMSCRFYNKIKGGKLQFQNIKMQQTLEIPENHDQKGFSLDLLNNFQQIQKEKKSKNQMKIALQSEPRVSNEKYEKKKNNLTPQEIKLIASLYSQHRSKWSLYTTRMIGKYFYKIFRNQREIKNFFYNSLRKLATKLSNIEKKKRLFQKNDLDTNMLRNLIDIEIIVKKTLSNYCCSDEQMVISRVKQDIFDNCFRGLQLDDDQLLKLSKDIRKLKFMFKNLRNIEKSQINQVQSLKFAMAVLEKQCASSEILSIKEKLKQKHIKLENQLKMLKMYSGNQPQQKDQNLENQVSLDNQNNWKVSENICYCEQCTQFHNFQQLQYFQAMQQLHEIELLREPKTMHELCLGESQKFSPGYMSKFCPYMPAICKIQASAQ